MEQLKRALPVFPLFLIATIYIAQSQLVSISNAYFHNVQLIPVVLLALAGLLSIHYQNSNAFFISFALSTTYIFGASNPEQLTLANMQVGRDSLYLLLPLNIACLALTKDRGILTSIGLSKLILLIAQIAAVVWISKYHSQAMGEFMYKQWIDDNTYSQFISQNHLIAWLLSLLLLVTSSIRTDNHLARAMIGVAIAIGLSTITQQHGNAWVFTATAALIVILSQLQASYKLAFFDQLTGLPGRRALEMRLSRLPRNYTIAMLDIDHFKKFNDRYGHDVGDQVLKLVASRIKKIGGGGKPARYGGEEFAIIFPGKRKHQCVSALEQLRQSVEMSAFQIRSGKRKSSERGLKKGGSKKVSVTISIGASERSPQNKKPYSVIKAADQALYRAKKAGRNCIRA